MNDLTFERADGDSLICVDESGAEYSVGITDQLKAAVNRTRAVAEVGEAPDVVIQIPEVLRPKDIQTLVRAGAQPSELAEASGLDPEHINRYAAPVLDERDFVSRQARALPLRRDPEARSLEELAFQRMAEHGIDPAAATWDAVRQVQGWIVRLDFEAPSGPVRARWQVDLASRALTALNDQAHWVVRGSEPESPIPALRHLSAVPGFDDGEDVQGGDNGDLDRDESGAPLSLLDGLSGHRGLRQPVSFNDETGPLTGDADVLELRQEQEEQPDWLTGGSTDLPQVGRWDDLETYEGIGRRTGASPTDGWPTGPVQADMWEDANPTDSQGALFGEAPVRSQRYSSPFSPILDEPAPPISAPQPIRRADPGPETDPNIETDPNPEPVPDPPRGRTTRSHAKRSSVPSWDEIVFGSSKTD
ncbi:MAG: DUF3071 domain-containing protein [Bifidobacteriaceae bacterium]|jgi:hypothetical protein|nr:DUF3071 domain-containing protein [Bifidobacteriaceae bacterium]